VAVIVSVRASGSFDTFMSPPPAARSSARSARAGAFLFGRRTYEAFSQAWPAMDDPADPVATALNHLPKYVVSTTRTDLPWKPAELVTDIAALKEKPGRELQIHGSATLGASLLARGLVDELRLVVAPVVVGQGRRLFPAEGTPAGMRLTDASATPGGLAFLRYEYQGTPTYGAYGV
jgi:dihydrofolate reductase